MNKSLMIIAGFLMFAASTFGQKYFSKTGEISFFSNTAMENIEAVSNSASTVIDLESGKIQWAVLIKSFEFEKALMQEHFNENYMESEKFPKAKFKGEIVDAGKLDFSKDGELKTEAKGMLTIHGETMEVTVPVIFVVKDGEVVGTSEFIVKPADYKIEIPSVVRDNIAKELELKIKANYVSLDK